MNLSSRQVVSWKTEHVVENSTHWSSLEKEKIQNSQSKIFGDLNLIYMIQYAIKEKPERL